MTKACALGIRSHAVGSALFACMTKPVGVWPERMFDPKPEPLRLQRVTVRVPANRQYEVPGFTAALF